MEEDIYEMENMQLDLVEELKNMEAANESLEAKNNQLIESNAQLEKGQAIYIGRRESKIDMVLSKYINNKFPEKTERLKIMFLRETEGVYRFGQRRVQIKVEMGNKLFVRVGGGYMHIDEFVKQYTDSEMDRLDRRDPLTRFTNKTNVQSIATSANEARERSPIRER
jgi:hypothetical protein